MLKMKTLFDMSITKKICLSGLITSLVVIFNKVIALNYISFIPFVRISFGSIALLIFASIAIGPIYGLIIGGVADVLGYFIFDMSSFAWFPQITATYMLLGFVPFFIWKAVSFIKNEKAMLIIEYAVFAVIFALICVFFAVNDTLTLYGKTYEFALYQKFLIPSICLLFFLVIIFFNLFIKKKFDKDDLGINIYQISFIVFVSEVLVNFLFGGLMKAWAFGWDMLLAIYICQAIVMFFNIPYNSYLIFVIMKISKRFLEK